MDLKVMGYDAKNWIDLARNRNKWRANLRMVMNLRFP